MQRFKLDGGSMNTFDAIQKAKEAEEKRRLRAEKFGLDIDDPDEKRRQRALKFGTGGLGAASMSKEELNEKRQVRAIRFGLPNKEEEDEK